MAIIKLADRGQFVALAAFAMVWLSGCGKSRPATYPVSGRITIGGKSPTGAWIVFHRSDTPDLRAMKPFGKVGEDGRFAMQTFVPDDGAPVGNYAVTVVWPAPAPKGDPDAIEGPDRLQGRYSDPKNPASQVTVRPENTVLEDITLR